MIRRKSLATKHSRENIGLAMMQKALRNRYDVSRKQVERGLSNYRARTGIYPMDTGTFLKVFDKATQRKKVG